MPAHHSSSGGGGGEEETERVGKGEMRREEEGRRRRGEGEGVCQSYTGAACNDTTSFNSNQRFILLQQNQ